MERTQRRDDLRLALSIFRHACRKHDEASEAEERDEWAEARQGAEWQLICALSELEEPYHWGYDLQELERIREQANTRYAAEPAGADLRSLLHMFDARVAYQDDLSRRVQGLIDLTGAYQRDMFHLLGRVHRNVRRAWDARPAESTRSITRED